MKVKNLLDDNEKKPSEPPKGEPIPIQVIAPWSNIIVKTKIPDEIFEKLLEMYEYTMKNNKSFGKQLVGQIDDEPEVTMEILQKFPEWSHFCLQTVEQFVRSQSEINYIGEPEKLQALKSDDFMSKIQTMWFVNQKPGEYNPIHIHTNCKVSAICYLKTPKQQIKGRKDHYQADGKVTFTNNTGTDMNFANHQCSFEPKAGDFYIFPALQHHAVWPYRSADPDDLRVSLSFNADVITASALKAQNENYEKMYEEMKKMKESEVKDDKSTDVSNINKSG
tara:strand:- start:87 stop:920 length:834 start_codon:yes stop_codon:yes gene_type:complete